MSGGLSAVLGIAVLVWVIANQVRVRPFSPRRLRTAGVLGVIGLVEVVRAAAAHPVSGLGWALLVAGLAIGAATGVARAATTRLWTRDGITWTQGHVGTVVLWIVGIGAHVGLDLLARVVAPSAETVNTASVLLFIGVSVGVQALVTAQRARSPRGASAGVAASGARA